MTNSSTHVYTDGACSGNPGPGGWAWAVDGGESGSGGEAETTNQRMELTAVLEALRQLDGAVTVHSDSTYVVNCFNDRWFEGWLARGWKNANKKPVANRDLWEPLVDIFERREEELTFVWVKGHSGDRMNDFVDAMAVAEVDTLKAEMVRPEPSQTVEVPWPSERAIAVVGTTKPGGDVVDALVGTVRDLDNQNDILISGLRRGVELLAAEAAHQVGIPVGVVLPFEDPASRWPPSDKHRFDFCLDAAEWVVVLPGDQAKPQTAVRSRNDWLWLAVVGAIIVDDHASVDEAEGRGLGVIAIDDDLV